MTTVSDGKDTKLLKAIHNNVTGRLKTNITVSDGKDTKLLKAIHNQAWQSQLRKFTVSDGKDTKLLKAIHNPTETGISETPLFQTAKILNFKNHSPQAELENRKTYAIYYLPSTTFT